MSKVSREDWFQNSSFVCLSIYLKQVDPNKSNVLFDHQAVTVDLFSRQDNAAYEKTWYLCHPIVPEQSTVCYLPQKVELKMKKREEGLFWKHLTSSATNDYSGGVELAGSSKDKSKEKTRYTPEQLSEEEEQSEDKDILTFFREIYENSDEDTRRAMMKSFVESQGKVLSTDWKKVSSQNMRYDSE